MSVSHTIVSLSRSQNSHLQSPFEGERQKSFDNALRWSSLVPGGEHVKKIDSVDRRPSPAEAPPIGKIHLFSKMAVTFEPLVGF